MADSSKYRTDSLPVTDRPWWKTKAIAALLLFVFLLAVALLVSGILFSFLRGSSMTDHHSSPTPRLGTTTPTPTTSVTPTGTVSPTPSPTSIPITVYFSKHPDSDDNFERVFPVSRTSATAGVATAAMRQLIAGPTVGEQDEGLFTAWSLSGTSACGQDGFEIRIVDSTATVQLCRTYTSSGAGNDARAKAEADATLTQFSNITKVIYLDNDGNCLFDQSGQNACLN